MTIQVEFIKPTNNEALFNLFKKFYQNHSMIICQQEIPNIQQIVGRPQCLIGGFEVSSDGNRATFVCCLDNLLKGAASQAIQNINTALGIEQTTGLSVSLQVNKKESTK